MLDVIQMMVRMLVCMMRVVYGLADVVPSLHMLVLDAGFVFLLVVESSSSLVGVAGFCH